MIIGMLASAAARASTMSPRYAAMEVPPMGAIPKGAP